MAFQTQPTLPTREQFLANGRIHTSYPPGQTAECNICIEEFADVVRLGCHDTHIFCFNCVSTWLKQSDCYPMCNKELFNTPENTPKMVLVGQASDLLQERGNMHEIEHFDAGPFGHSQDDYRYLSHGNHNARWWLGRGCHAPGRINLHGQIRLNTGTCFVHATRLATNFAMLGNYIPVISELRNRAYSDQQKEHRTLVLTTLWNIIKKYDGKVMDTTPQSLQKRLRKKLKHIPDFDQIQFLQPAHGFEDSRLLHDLDCLLDFVAFTAHQEYRRQRRHGRNFQQQGKWEKKLAPIKDFFKQLGPANWGPFHNL